MKIILKFDDESAQQDAAVAMSGYKLLHILTDIKNYLRNKIKHAELTDIEYEIYDKIRDDILKIIEEAELPPQVMEQL